MIRLILWAMATGFVTGAVWFAILFLRRGRAAPPFNYPPSFEDDPSQVTPHSLTRHAGAPELRAGLPIDQVNHPHAAPEIDVHRDRSSDRGRGHS